MGRARGESARAALRLARGADPLLPRRAAPPENRRNRRRAGRNRQVPALSRPPDVARTLPSERKTKMNDLFTQSPDLGVHEAQKRIAQELSQGSRTATVLLLIAASLATATVT